MTQRSDDKDGARPFLVNLLLGILDKMGAVMLCLFFAALAGLLLRVIASSSGSQDPLPMIYGLLAGIPVFGVFWIFLMVQTHRAEKRAPK